MKRTITLALVALGVFLPATAQATITATPLTDPASVVAFNQPIAVGVTSDVTTSVDFNENSAYNPANWPVDDAVCTTVQIKRGVQHRRCPIVAGGTIVYHGFPVGGGWTYVTVYDTPTHIFRGFSWATTADPNPPVRSFWSYPCGRPWMDFYKRLGC